MFSEKKRREQAISFQSSQALRLRRAEARKDILKRKKGKGKSISTNMWSCSSMSIWSAWVSPILGCYTPTRVTCSRLGKIIPSCAQFQELGQFEFSYWASQTFSTHTRAWCFGTAIGVLGLFAPASTEHFNIFRKINVGRQLYFAMIENIVVLK